VLVRLRGGAGRDDAGWRRGAPPPMGRSEQIAAGLLVFAREAIAHPQLGLHPITEAVDRRDGPVPGHLARA